MKSFGRRIGDLAAAHPDRTAVIFARRDGSELTTSWAELEARSNQAARLLAAQGGSSASMVMLVLPNTPDHLVAAIGAWKLGACVLPVSASMPADGIGMLAEAAEADLIVQDLSGLEAHDTGSLPDRVPQPGRATATGGSTGLPKVIVDPSPWAAEPGEFARSLGPRLGMRAGQVQLVATALYHLVPFVRSHFGLFEDHTLVLMEKFEAEQWLKLVERHRVQFTFLVPTLMARLLRVPNLKRRDLSSMEALTYGGGSAPVWIVRAWIELMGPERVYESYGASEMPGWLSIRGDEWLAHQGSVGKGRGVQVEIRDEAGGRLAAGQEGEVWILDEDNPGTPYEFRAGRGPKVDADGFVSVGDIGRLDADGYLYILDRREDLIVTGGENVYAAEVEAVLSEHPAVADVVVIGLPDEDWGRRVHAIIQPVDGRHPPSREELDEHFRKRLPGYKAPKGYEFMAELPRDGAGKVPRSRLVAERTGGAPSAQ